MKNFYLVLLIALTTVAVAPAAPSPAMVSEITLGPQLFAIENGMDGAPGTTYAVYYGDGNLVYSPTGVPMRNLSPAQALAFARQNGLAP